MHGLLAAPMAQGSGCHELRWHPPARLSDILKWTSAAQLYREIRNLGLIQAEVSQAIRGVDNGDDAAREVRVCKDLMKVQVTEPQLDGQGGEPKGSDSLSDSLTVTLGKLPHISGLQFFFLLRSEGIGSFG